MDLLLERLERKQWGYKYSKYKDMFDYLEIIRQVKSPLISVIVVSWRLHPLMYENFERIKLQRKQLNFEVIFVDNGGKGGEFDCFKPYTDKWIQLNENTGACVARNIGALFAEAELLMFLEDDSIPDNDLIESHYLTHVRFRPFSVRGACLPVTPNPFNEKQTWYYLGNSYFPTYASIEGNTSYSAEVFFEVGGWDDTLRYGGEGKALAIKIYELYPDYSKQIYSPISFIYHDYAVSEHQLIEKHSRQQDSFRRLEKKYPSWARFDDNWPEFFGDSSNLKESIEWSQNLELQNHFQVLKREIISRNQKFIDVYMSGKIIFRDNQCLQEHFKKNQNARTFCIFGVGTKGEKTYEWFKSQNFFISYFTDNNPELWGKLKNDKLIINPNDLNKDNFIFISSSWANEIAKQLIELGFEREKDFLIIV